MYVKLYIYIYIHVHVHIHMYTYTYIHIHVHIYIHIHTHTYMYMYSLYMFFPASSISLPVIKPVSYYAIPLHLTHWDIRVRPQGWGLKFCTLPLTWAQNAPTNLRECKTIGDTINHSFRYVMRPRPV